METTRILWVVTVFAVAGAVKGITGMGLPTVAVSLLGLWMAPMQAAALLVVPSLATNLAQCRGPYWRPLLARLWPGWVAIALGTVLVPGLGASVSADTAHRWLGGLLIAYGMWGMWRPSLPDLARRGAWLSVLAGVLTGVVTATTAVFVLPWVPYLQTQRLDKDEMVQALGLSFTVATLALALRLQLSAPLAVWSGPAFSAGLAALAGAFAGMKLGELLRGRLGGAAFSRALCLVFIALGLANWVRA